MNTNKAIFDSQHNLLNNIDKKALIDHVIFFAKLMNFGIFAPTIIIFGFAYNWQIDYKIFILLAVIFSIGNGVHLVWYYITIYSFSNSNKVVVINTVTDVYYLDGEIPRTVIYFGLEKLDISNHLPSQLIKIGDKVKIHYFQKANKQKGSLIRIEKI